MSSIRRFLVVVLLATITLVNFVAALHGYRTSMERAGELFDTQLADIASVLMAAALTSEKPTIYTENLSGDETDIAFQVWRDGFLVFASETAPEQPISPLGEALNGAYSDVNFGGYRWRAYTRDMPERDARLIVAQRADIRFDLAESIIIESVLPIILGLPLEGLLIWIIVGRGLRPLRALAGEMADKRSDDLSPLTETEPPKELAAVTSSINGLLNRLASAFDREKRFAADAAHELRTPISVLKVQLHNVLRDAEGDDVQLRSLQSAVERMEHSVEQVLMLYRTTPDQFAARVEKIDMAGLARTVIAELYPQIEAKHQQIELVADSVFVRGDSFALHTLVTNLIENASKYSGENGEIRVVLERQEASTVLKVEDSGPGIPVDQYDKVFERFYRVSTDRQDASVPGSGIGLAVVQHIAEIHSASISLGRSGFTSGLVVTVVFPDSWESGKV